MLATDWPFKLIAPELAAPKNWAVSAAPGEDTASQLLMSVQVLSPLPDQTSVAALAETPNNAANGMAQYRNARTARLAMEFFLERSVFFFIGRSGSGGVIFRGESFVTLRWRNGAFWQEIRGFVRSGLKSEVYASFLLASEN
jgi:hypothetical protein